MNCQEVRDLMSDYLEQYLAEPEADLLRDHLADCGNCRAELADLEETLNVVHGLPPQEPALDLWREFAPKFAEIRAEMRLGLIDRMRLYFSRLSRALAEGWMIFIAAIRYNRNRKAQRYA